jgi:hypothetical protein
MEGRRRARVGLPPSVTQTQAYVNSDLSDHPVAESYAEDPDRLFNDRDPNLAIAHEKPEHRLAVYMKARGASNNEIARALGYTAPWVSQLVRQPWFRARLVAEQRSAGIDELRSTIEGAALDSVLTLIDLRDNVANPPAVRRTAADSLLDRYLGKPAVKIIEEKRSPADTSEAVAAIDRELAEIDSELQQACS